MMALVWRDGMEGKRAAEGTKVEVESGEGLVYLPST